VPPRYDVSAVPFQGGYVAKRCPVRAQWDTIRPCEPLPPSASLGRRLARGIEFEARIAATLIRLHPAACDLLARADGGEQAAAMDRRAEREAATLAAMAARTGVIIGGRLPADTAGRRAGEPDLLVLAPESGYRAVDIKHHRSLTGPGPGGMPGLCSGLDSLTPEAAEVDEAAMARRRREDLLQLAHYQRMLEAAGLAAPGRRLGGIIGVEEMVVWYDLDALAWRTPSASGGTKPRSTMEVYDFEFDFRLDIIAVAQAAKADSSISPLVVPVRIGECAQCPWWSCCGPRLVAGSGDVSLLPRVGWRQWRTHRDHGVTDRAALANLDHRTAVLVATGVDLRPVLAAMAEQPGETALSAVIGERRQRQLAALTAAGIATLRDARSLCARTASYSDAPMRDLPEQIDQARAALGDHSVYRRRGVTVVQVARADVEADVDMENTPDGVYLWGVLVTARPGLGGLPVGYRAFISWEPMTSQVEAELFAAFWEWLTSLRAAVAAARLTFRGYCYNASAENSQLHRIAASTTFAAEVASFVGSDQWVDLYRVFDTQLITGHSTALKAVAPLAGFSWRVTDPGGDEALARYDRAVGQDGEAIAREWLLAYNKNDTEATLALRDWLTRSASECPPIDITVDQPISGNKQR
jgi:predicted RecB family nuclease